MKIQTRARYRPYKRWTESETNKLLDFLEEAGEIEKPSAKIFYKKCKEVKKFDANWNLLRCKVTNLKNKLRKANEYRISTNAGDVKLEEGVDSFEEKIKQICPYYNRLTKIFGTKTSAYQFSDTGKECHSNLVMGLEETALPVSLPPVLPSPVDTGGDFHTNYAAGLHKTVPRDSPRLIPIISCEMSNDKSFAPKIKKSEPKTSAGFLLNYQRDRVALELKRLDFEREKFEKQLEITKAELDLKKEELEFKKFALQQEERIKKLEIEKDERIAMFELQMKYKKSE